VLKDDSGPLLVVEGWSDVAAAFDLGFNAVGRPSNLACTDILADLLRGYSGEVIIVGENDARVNKLTGKTETPGRDGQVAAFQAVKRTVKSVSMLLPPPHVKDLRAWFSKYKLTREQFLEHHETHKEIELPGSVLANNEPATVAAAFLKEKYTIDGDVVILRWNKGFYVYIEGRWVELEDEALIAQMQTWSLGKSFIKPGPKGDTVERLVATIHSVKDWMQALFAGTLLSQTVVPPSWRNLVDAPEPRDLVVFRNCIVDVSGFGRGGEAKILEPTPNLFTLSGLPYDYQPGAKCPAWEAFLQSTLGDDPEKIKLLAEWMGYTMVPDTSRQTFAYWLGKPGSGKGTTARVHRAMLGGNLNCASSTMGDLSSRFGLEVLIGKLLCVLPDARLSARSDAMAGLEKLLNLTGEDATNVDRKNKTAITANALTARIVIVSNELISLPDKEHATTRRIRILHFANDFTTAPDTDLTNRLTAEIPGIAVWALEGLKRLRCQGRFTEPESSTLAAKEWAQAISPAAEFSADSCLVAANAEIGEDELYDAAVKWNGRKDDWCRSMRKFEAALRLAEPSVRRTVIPSKNAMTPGRVIYRGITLTPDAARRLIGRPLDVRK
jgi:P4 family phage/plasmid primase-like protien